MEKEDYEKLVKKLNKWSIGKGSKIRFKEDSISDNIGTLNYITVYTEDPNIRENPVLSFTNEFEGNVKKEIGRAGVTGEVEFNASKTMITIK